MTLKDLLKDNRGERIVLYVDNDEVFTALDGLNMHPEDALIEALELLGFRPEKV